eukprot:1798771-Pyramimonas_sp.AAC.1
MFLRTQVPTISSVRGKECREVASIRPEGYCAAAREVLLHVHARHVVVLEMPQEAVCILGRDHH